MPFPRRVTRRFATLVLVAAVAAVLPATMAAGDGGGWDLAHPDLTFGDGDFIDVGVAVDVTADTPVSALGIDARFDVATELTVEIRELAGVTPGDDVVRASTAVSPSPFRFHDVPVAFTFLAGHRYDIRFRVPEFWTARVNGHLGWNENYDLQTWRGYARGPFVVLDGGGGIPFLGAPYDYASYADVPHVHVIGAGDAVPPTVDVRVADGDDEGPRGWYDLASSGPDGVTIEVTATDESALAALRCVDNGHVAVATTSTAVAFDVGDGVHNLSCSATDAFGNVGVAETLQVKVDQTPPALSPRVHPNPVVENQAAAAVAGAADPFIDGSGCEEPSPRQPGHHAVSCWATDLAGNRATGVATYEVLYAFDGFFAPVRMGEVNRARAGASVPLKFSLDGFAGLDVLAGGSPEVRACGATALVARADGKLSYDADDDVYVYVWKTDKAWSGGCYEVTVRLDDGSAKVVQFSLT